MGLRKTLNENPIIPVIGVLLAMAVCGYILWSIVMAPQAGSLGADWTSYYTIDDGKTFFADSHKPSEHFQKDGKDAHMAIVFTCDDDKTRFVGYMMKREDLPDNRAGAPEGAVRTTNYIKRPGDKEWVPDTSYGRWMQVENSVKCPGGGTLVRVHPTVGMMKEDAPPPGKGGGKGFKGGKK